jgi:hypothetical protein
MTLGTFPTHGPVRQTPPRPRPPIEPVGRRGDASRLHRRTPLRPLRPLHARARDHPTLLRIWAALDLTPNDLLLPVPARRPNRKSAGRPAWSVPAVRQVEVLLSLRQAEKFIADQDLQSLGVQVELRETLDRAEEIIGCVCKLAAISARASYLTITWGKRLGTPAEREKQALLDEIDNQLAELKVSPEGIT